MLLTFIGPHYTELVKHYYFRLDEEEGSIGWSRSRDAFFGTFSKALVLEVHGKPSNTIKNLPKFSPDALHFYSFWVGTSGGVLDLLAYNEDAYKVWLIELDRVAQRNASLSRSAVQAFKGSSVHSRPASSHGGAKQTPRSAVSPGDVGIRGLDGSPADRSSVTMDTSVFVREREPSGDGLQVESDQSILNSTSRAKGTQVVPVATVVGSSSSNVRKSGLSFIGESYRSGDHRSGDHSYLQDDSSDDII